MTVTEIGISTERRGATEAGRTREIAETTATVIVIVIVIVIVTGVEIETENGTKTGTGTGIAEGGVTKIPGAGIEVGSVIAARSAAGAAAARGLKDNMAATYQNAQHLWTTTEKDETRLGLLLSTVVG